MPRPIADWLALWRDLPRQPRQVLLNRAHLRGSLRALIVVLLAGLLIDHPVMPVLACVAALMFGPSAFVTVAGSVAHALRDRDLIWPDLECEFCGDGPDDDGDDGEPDVDGPDGGGLMREITDYLHARITTPTH